MNSKHCNEAFMAMLEAEVREQEQRQIEHVQPPETMYHIGRKGPTLHYRGRVIRGIN